MPYEAMYEVQQLILRNYRHGVIDAYGCDAAIAGLHSAYRASNNLRSCQCYSCRNA